MKGLKKFLATALVFINCLTCTVINSNAATDGTTQFVTRCYEIALGRKPDQAGLNDWVNKLNSGESCGVSVAYGFVYSSEFQNAGYDNSTYIDKMYNMLLGREADAGGKQYWLNNLSNGYTRYDIFMGFANSEEFYNLCKSYGIFSGFYIAGSDMNRVANINGFVDRLYYLCLGRHGDQGGQSNWADGIGNGTISGTFAAYGFIFSTEYLNKNTSNSEYVTMLYNVFFGRTPDEAGFNSWLEKLNNGSASREAVMLGFSKSAEFVNLCNAYGINVGNETFADITYTPVSSTPTTTPTSAPTTVAPTVVPTYTPTNSPTPTGVAKNEPDLSVPYVFEDEEYQVKAYQIDIDHEFMELYYENLVNQTCFTYNGFEYDLTTSSPYPNYGMDLECDGTVYGFFLDDLSNNLNKRINDYRVSNGWEEYSIIDYELCRLRAIEGTVGGYDLGHFRTCSGTAGSSNMAWGYGVNIADFFWNAYYYSPGHLAKWQNNGVFNMCTATFVRCEWVPSARYEEGGYWAPLMCCNNQMFLNSQTLCKKMPMYQVYTGLESLYNNPNDPSNDVDYWYDYYVVQGNVEFTPPKVHLAWEDI